MSPTTRTVDGRRSSRTTEEESTESTENPISDDELFHLLQNSRRRAVVRYLRGREGPVRMREVAEQVAAWEHDTTVAQLSSEQRQRVYIALYQSHLETLADAGVIEYNKPRGIIEPQPLLDRVERYLHIEDHPGDGEDGTGDGSLHPWSRYYLLVSAASTALFGAAALGMPVLTPTTVSVATVLAFVVVMFAQLSDGFPWSTLTRGTAG